MANFDILFCLSQAQASRITTPGCVVVWPLSTSWNDFGYGFRAKARISAFHNGTGDLKVDLLVIPSSAEPDAHRFDLWLNHQRSSLSENLGINSLGLNFFSILQSEKTYQDLVQWANSARISVDEVLSPLRDVVYFRAHSLETEKLSVFLLSQAAKNGVFRNEQTYLAWHRAARVLMVQNALPNVGDARTNFMFETLLPGFSEPHSVRISYGVPEPLNDRCHALIGRNGVGKSQLLRELIIALGQRMDGTTTDPFTSDAVPKGTHTTLFPNEFRVNRILALCWDSRTVFPPEARLNSRLEYLYCEMHKEDLGSGDPAHMSDSNTPASQLIQLLRAQLGDLGNGFKRLRATLRPLFDYKDIALAFRRTDGGNGLEWLSLQDLQRAGEGRQLEYFGNLESAESPRRIGADGTSVELSSGERMFLLFAIRCAARVETGTLLILDEPETHLHPTLISDFMRVLSALLDETKSTAIVATHSPFVVRELPARCVHVLRVDEERTPTISNAFLRTFGASVDALAADIFEDAESAQVNRDVAKAIAKSGLSGEEIRERYGKELSLELMSEIRQLMRDANK